MNKHRWHRRHLKAAHLHRGRTASLLHTAMYGGGQSIPAAEQLGRIVAEFMGRIIAVRSALAKDARKYIENAEPLSAGGWIPLPTHPNYLGQHVFFSRCEAGV